MKTEDFTDPKSGILISTIGNSRAFVPAPLPPVIDLSKIALKLAKTMLAVGELRGACRRLQNPDILVRPLQRREALTSSAMEGTFTTEDALLLAELDGIKGAKDDSTREVYNHLRALNQSLEMLDTLPISHRVIKKAHEILLSGLSRSRGAQKRPGQYKQDQNWIGGLTIDVARFIPPPPAETQTCMDELERYINREIDHDWSPLIDLALVHYQLEAIHPFADGNGRVGRMLISLMAVHNGLLDMPVLYISPALEQKKDQYIDLMYQVSTEGKWIEWLNFFFMTIEESCIETIASIDRLITLQELYRKQVTEKARTSNIITLVDYLFDRPIIRVSDAEKKLGVTYRAARQIIKKLQDIGILKELTGWYPAVFYAPDILNITRPGDKSE